MPDSSINDYTKCSYSRKKFPWNTCTSLLLFNHISQSHPDLRNNDGLVLIKKFMVEEKTRKSEAGEVYTKQQQDENVERMFIHFFMASLPLFFQLPNPHDLSDNSLHQNEILSGFIAFLLRILESEETFWFGFRKHCYTILQDKLAFIFTFLGDTPFWCSGLVKDLLVELGFLVEEAGTFICSSIFVSKKKRRKNFDAGIKSLLETISVFLNEKLKHSLKILRLPMTAATSKLDILRSPFIVDSLLHDLEDLMNGRFDLSIHEVEDQIKMLIEGLSFCQTVLKDIQMPRVTVNEVKKSLLQIKEVTYEAEYLIHTYVTGRLQTWYLNLRLPDIIQKVELNGRKLQEIKTIHDKDIMNIKHRFSYETVRNPEVVVESMVIGFDDNKTKILADLIGGSRELQNICIYGMPGIGKSTMAKKLYVDRTVYHRFDLRIWCVVSQIYEKKKLLNDIFSSLANKLGKDKISQEGDESLGLEIYKCLYGRRYLIIMDDVWHFEMWDDINRFFPDNKNGSRILVTSRVKDTAPVNSIFHAPPFLSDIQCCELFLKKVFPKEPCPPELLGIAKGIASKCHGLPLAVVVVAGIMVNLGMDESMWKNVEVDLKSYMSKDQSGYLKILGLSYEHLPDHLKQCFLYLGRFYGNEELPMRKVIRLWIAQGFVHKEKKSLELVAEDYCSDLINRSLLTIAKRKSNGGIKACRIHDLLRDMCLRKGEEVKFLKHIHESTTYEKHSHLILRTARTQTFVAQHCRSLAGDLWSFGYQATQMPLLRVIDGLKLESSSSMEKLWSLFHVKYLSFSAREFPLGLCMLANLEYVHLDTGCTVYVPSTILKMVKLKHVYITPEAVFEKSYDASITTKLESLSHILVRNKEETGILKCSPQLHKLSCICSGQLFPDLSSLTELESLKLKFTTPLNGELTEFNFPLTVKELSLYGTSLPSEKMRVVGSLPNLHVLKLFHCDFVSEVWTMTYGEFEELMFLKLSNVSIRKWIADSEHLPSLQYLVVEYVRNLEAIPSDLGCIPTLETIEVRSCRYEIEKSALQIEKEQREYGNEDLKVIISGFSFEEIGCMRTRNKVTCCHFSSDGTLLASGLGKKAVIWNIDTLQTEATPEEHQDLITDIRFRPNSTHFATTSFDKSVRLWDAANPGYCLNAYTGHTSHVMSLDFHPGNSDLFCFCDSKNEIHYWNITPFSRSRISKQGGSEQVRFQPVTGNMLAAASDNVVSIYDVENDRQTHDFQGHSGIVSYLCWDLKGNMLASLCENSIRLWSLTTGECIHELISNGNQFHSCAFHPHYSTILVIGGFQRLELWNIAEDKTMTIPAHENIIAAVAQSPQTAIVASASHDSYVKLWK